MQFDEPDGPDPASHDVLRALQIRQEIEAFNRCWAPLPAGEPCPTFTWEQVERQLVELAPTELQAELVHKLILRIRTLAPVKPAEMVLRELLRAAALVLEEPTDGMHPEA